MVGPIIIGGGGKGFGVNLHTNFELLIQGPFDHDLEQIPAREKQAYYKCTIGKIDLFLLAKPYPQLF